LISHLHNSNMGKQLDLFGNEVPEWKYVFLGVFLGFELGISAGIWVSRLEREAVVRLLEGRSWKN